MEAAGFDIYPRFEEELVAKVMTVPDRADVAGGLRRFFNMRRLLRKIPVLARFFPPFQGERGFWWRPRSPRSIYRIHPCFLRTVASQLLDAFKPQEVLLLADRIQDWRPVLYERFADNPLYSGLRELVSSRATDHPFTGGFAFSEFDSFDLAHIAGSLCWDGIFREERLRGPDVYIFCLPKGPVLRLMHEDAIWLFSEHTAHHEAFESVCGRDCVAGLADEEVSDDLIVGPDGKIYARVEWGKVSFEKPFWDLRPVTWGAEDDDKDKKEDDHPPCFSPGIYRDRFGCRIYNEESGEVLWEVWFTFEQVSGFRESLEKGLDALNVGRETEIARLPQLSYKPDEKCIRLCTRKGIVLLEECGKEGVGLAIELDADEVATILGFVNRFQALVRSAPGRE
jgi:hypothetical protein